MGRSKNRDYQYKYHIKVLQLLMLSFKGCSFILLIHPYILSLQGGSQGYLTEQNPISNSVPGYENMSHIQYLVQGSLINVV